MKTKRVPLFQAAIMVMVMAVALAGCTTGSSTTPDTCCQQHQQY